MVISVNLGFYDAEPPPACGSQRIKIDGGPLYPVQSVLTVLLGGDQALQVTTRKCTKDVESLCLDHQALAALIRQAVTQGNYKGSEWCRLSEKSVAACDAYVLNRAEWRDELSKTLDCQYYLKFAIGRSGVLLLLVSCHL